MIDNPAHLPRKFGRRVTAKAIETGARRNLMHGQKPFQHKDNRRTQKAGHRPAQGGEAMGL